MNQNECIDLLVPLNKWNKEDQPSILWSLFASGEVLEGTSAYLIFNVTRIFCKSRLHAIESTAVKTWTITFALLHPIQSPISSSFVNRNESQLALSSQTDPWKTWSFAFKILWETSLTYRDSIGESLRLWVHRALDLLAFQLGWLCIIQSLLSL